MYVCMIRAIYCAAKLNLEKIVRLIVGGAQWNDKASNL